MPLAAQAGVVKATKEGVVLDPSAVADRRTEAEKKASGGGLQLTTCGRVLTAYEHSRAG